MVVRICVADGAGAVAFGERRLCGVVAGDDGKMDEGGVLLSFLLDRGAGVGAGDGAGVARGMRGAGAGGGDRVLPLVPDRWLLCEA